MVDKAARKLGEWMLTLPQRDGDVDLDALGLTMEELIEAARARIAIPSPEEALEGFLNQALRS